MAWYDEGIAKAFAMNDEVWMRHANPWSVWTRVATLPILLLVIWSHSWIGWSFLLPLALLAIWLWLNPRLFSKPHTTQTWASKAVLGERVWLNRKRIPIPTHHAFMPNMLMGIAGIGAILALAGAWLNELWPLLLGAALCYMGKMWFCDRMVWLFEEMKDSDPRYREWLY